MAAGERQQPNGDGALRLLEQQRFAGWNLASRIRFLREEIKQGRDAVDNLKELGDKTSELAGLFPAPDDYGIITFEVRDTAETRKNASGFIVGRRNVEVINPNAQQGALKKFEVSLLPAGQVRENLAELGVSEVLPRAYGGI